MSFPKNIVLLHGWGASTKKLKPLADQLERFGWKVFLPKLPGFDMPSPEAVWGLEDYSDFITNKSDTFFKGKEYFILGHSFGGGIAIKSVLRDRKNMVSGIVLCANRGISRTSVFKRTIFLVMAKVGKVFLAIPQVGSVYKKVIYKLAREHDYERAQGIMKEVFKKVIGEDLKPSVKKINVPVLVLWGTNDRVTPITDAYYIKRNLKGSKLVEFEGEGHRLPYNKPGEMAREVNLWMQSL